VHVCFLAWSKPQGSPSNSDRAVLVVAEEAYECVLSVYETLPIRLCMPYCVQVPAQASALRHGAVLVVAGEYLRSVSNSMPMRLCTSKWQGSPSDSNGAVLVVAEEEHK